MTILDVRPADRHGQYTAALDGRDLVTSRQPFLDAARVLLSEGADPQTTLVMRWVTTGTDSLRSLSGLPPSSPSRTAPDGLPALPSV